MFSKCHLLHELGFTLCVFSLQNRLWQRDHRDLRAIQPDAGFYNDVSYEEMSEFCWAVSSCVLFLYMVKLTNHLCFVSVSAAAGSSHWHVEQPDECRHH